MLGCSEQQGIPVILTLKHFDKLHGNVPYLKLRIKLLSGMFQVGEQTVGTGEGSG